MATRSFYEMVQLCERHNMSENHQYDEILDWMWGGKKAAPAAPAATPAAPKKINTNDLLAAAQQSVDKLYNHINHNYGHNSSVVRTITPMKTSMDQVSQWWKRVQQYTADVKSSGGEEALQRMRADQRLSQTLHQGMRDYKAPVNDPVLTRTLDPRRQPARGYLGNGNDATVAATLAQGRTDYADAPMAIPLDQQAPVGPVGARKIAQQAARRA